MAREDNLLDVLADIYDTREKSSTIVDLAKLDRGLIAFNERALDNWGSILSEARKQNKLESLVEEVCNQYDARRSELVALLELWIAPAVTPQPSAAILPSPKKFAPSDPDLLIARELHWNRISVATTFLGMIKGVKKYPYQVMGLQDSRDADLDSLIDRFEEMCQKAEKPKPLLHAKILLSAAYPTPPKLAIEILEYLGKAALDNDQAIVVKQAATIQQALNDIDQSSTSTSLSDLQLVRKLNKCLEDVTQHSTVVLLLQRFHELRDPSSTWLRDVWVFSHAWKVAGLITVIAGETGLQNLSGQEKKGIYFPNQLPSMTWEDFFSWAREGFGFNWYTEEMAQEAYETYEGNPREFARFLKLRKMEDDIRG